MRGAVLCGSRFRTWIECSVVSLVSGVATDAEMFLMVKPSREGESEETHRSAAAPPTSDLALAP